MKGFNSKLVCKIGTVSAIVLIGLSQMSVARAGGIESTLSDFSAMGDLRPLSPADQFKDSGTEDLQSAMQIFHQHLNREKKDSNKLREAETIVLLKNLREAGNLASLAVYNGHRHAPSLYTEITLEMLKLPGQADKIQPFIKNSIAFTAMALKEWNKDYLEEKSQGRGKAFLNNSSELSSVIGDLESLRTLLRELKDGNGKHFAKFRELCKQIRELRTAAAGDFIWGIDDRFNSLVMEGYVSASVRGDKAAGKKLTRLVPTEKREEMNGQLAEEFKEWNNLASQRARASTVCSTRSNSNPISFNISLNKTSPASSKISPSSSTLSSAASSPPSSPRLSGDDLILMEVLSKMEALSNF